VLDEAEAKNAKKLSKRWLLEKSLLSWLPVFITSLLERYLIG